jgi:hypothetical protein
MMTFRSALSIAAAAMLLGGASAFAASSSGHTPDYNSSAYQKLMGNGSAIATQQGADATEAVKQADSSVISQLESPTVDSKLSPEQLSSLADSFVTEGRFGTGVAPAQVYF